MPRRKRLRKVVAPPGFKGYKPYGNSKHKRQHVELLYEEYEAVKLADYDLMNHLEASKLMDVSRPTFARIYESARRKMANALVETREIRSVCGNAVLNGTWYVCNVCNASFTIPAQITNQGCPICRSRETKSIKN